MFSYVYNYTDHLGNTRLSYTKDTATGSLKILEESNYYPFGLKHNSYNVDNFQPEYKYKYNGKELQDELGLNQYDYGARNYDPSYVRTLTQDPLAEKFYSYSSYSFLNNNPISYIDPSGMEAYKSQVDRSSEMSNSEWNSNRRADMDRQAGGDGMDIANPDGYVKNRSTATASDAQEEGEDKDDDGGGDPPGGKKGKYYNKKPTHNADNRLQEHYDEAVTLSEWSKANDGLTREQVINQRANRSSSPLNSQQGGPNLRYVFHPKTGNVIDMRHMLIMGNNGPLVGNMVEVGQKMAGLASGLNRQDFYSNSLGYGFYNTYNDLGVKFMRFLGVGTNFSSSINSYLNR